MPKWSDWILLANEHTHYADDLEDDGPACYELGLMEEDDPDEQIDPMYVGETCDLYQRAVSYGEDGSHLSKIIDSHLRRGFLLYIRYKLFDSKEDAQEYELKRLEKYDYDWNIRNNT